MRNPMRAYVDPDILELRMGQDPLISMRVGSIILYAARIEFHIERAIWRLTDLKPEGTRPSTDAKMISELIGTLSEIGARRLIGDASVMVATWCSAATNAFKLRHDIAHGISYSIEGAFIFNRNPRMEGELRKRDTSIFWADENILELIREAFAVLFRCIQGIATGKVSPDELATPACLSALRDARSVFGEFTSLDYNPSFEKY